MNFKNFKIAFIKFENEYIHFLIFIFLIVLLIICNLKFVKYLLHSFLEKLLGLKIK